MKTITRNLTAVEYTLIHKKDIEKRTIIISPLSEKEVAKLWKDYNVFVTGEPVEYKCSMDIEKFFDGAEKEENKNE